MSICVYLTVMSVSTMMDESCSVEHVANMTAVMELVGKYHHHQTPTTAPIATPKPPPPIHHSRRRHRRKYFNVTISNANINNKDAVM